jgi:hypothetical protein
MTQFNRAALAQALEVLGSDHAGEALAAARLVTAMIRKAGFTWDQVLRPDLPAGQSSKPAPPGPGPMGMRRERELSPYEQFFMLLLSPRTPSHVKKELRGWEARVLDGEITPQEQQDLRHLFRQFVA